jgi:hypothetical protein
MKQFPERFWMWASKHMSHFYGVGLMMKRWGFWDNDLCPCCHDPDETTLHLFLCRHYRMTINFDTQIKLMEEWMCSHNTHPDIQRYFSLAIRAQDPNTRFETFSSPLCQEAAIGQDAAHGLAKPPGRQALKQMEGPTGMASS